MRPAHCKYLPNCLFFSNQTSLTRTQVTAVEWGAGCSADYARACACLRRSGYVSRPCVTTTRHASVWTDAFLRRAAWTSGALALGLPALASCTHQTRRQDRLPDLGERRVRASANLRPGTSRACATAQSGLRVGGRSFPVEILVRDTQSMTGRAARGRGSAAARQRRSAARRRRRFALRGR